MKTGLSSRFPGSPVPPAVARPRRHHSVWQTALTQGDWLAVWPVTATKEHISVAFGGTAQPHSADREVGGTTPKKPMEVDFPEDDEDGPTPPMVPPNPPIIRIRRKVRDNSGKRHADSWKVAYADFVTALMALFIVLWLMSSSADVQKSVAGYFRDPKGFGAHMGSTMIGSGEGLNLITSSMSLLQGELEKSIRNSPRFEDIRDYVQMTIMSDGLRVELVDTEKGLFFENGKTVPTEKGKALIEQLAPILGSMPRAILVEGHTDSKPFGSGNFTNWELSINRANAARAILEMSGLRPHQVAQVRGFADQQPRPAKARDDPSNRRISIVVQFSETPDADSR